MTAYWLNESLVRVTDLAVMCGQETRRADDPDAAGVERKESQCRYQAIVGVGSW